MTDDEIPGDVPQVLALMIHEPVDVLTDGVVAGERFQVVALGKLAVHVIPVLPHVRAQEAGEHTVASAMLLVIAPEARLLSLACPAAVPPLVVEKVTLVAVLAEFSQQLTSRLAALPALKPTLVLPVTRLAILLHGTDQILRAHGTPPQVPEWYLGAHEPRFRFGCTLRSFLLVDDHVLPGLRELFLLLQEAHVLIIHRVSGNVMNVALDGDLRVDIKGDDLNHVPQGFSRQHIVGDVTDRGIRVVHDHGLIFTRDSLEKPTLAILMSKRQLSRIEQIAIVALKVIISTHPGRVRKTLRKSRLTTPRNSSENNDTLRAHETPPYVPGMVLGRS